MSEFEEKLGDAIREALQEGAKTPKVVNTFRYEILQRVFDLFVEAFAGLPVEIKFEIEQLSNCAAIIADFREIKLDEQRIQGLISALEFCENFDIIVRYSDIEMSVTIPNVLVG